jgi:hypothetical protein
MPMSELMKLLPQISHDRNGEFKINITKDFELALKGRGNRRPLKEFLNKWELIGSPSKTSGEVTSAEESFHTVLQGRLIEIGNDRGLQTYSPNRAKKFNNVQLSDLTTLDKCPEYSLRTMILFGTSTLLVSGSWKTILSTFSI